MAHRGGGIAIDEGGDQQYVLSDRLRSAGRAGWMRRRIRKDGARHDDEGAWREDAGVSTEKVHEAVVVVCMGLLVTKSVQSTVAPASADTASDLGDQSGAFHCEGIAVADTTCS